MLKNAVMSFYQAGIRGYALHIYKELQRLYPGIEDFHGTLEEYVKLRLRDELDSLGIQDAQEEIISALMEGYYLLAIHEDDQATVREQFAQQVYDYYNKRYEDPKFRINLPPMDVLKYIALGQFLNNDMYPLYIRQGLVDRIKNEQPELYKRLGQIEEELSKKAEQQSQGTQP
jgi:hypothetical protein